MAAAADEPTRPPAKETGKAEGLRERKKRATRQLISDLATKLFFERGFDNVTIDEVAEAANVSRVTVFNYFTRKEDLLFDRTDYAQQLVAAALAERGRRSPVATLRDLAHALVAAGDPVASITPPVVGFWKIVADSPALRAHARAFSETLERDLARMLADSVDAPPNDPGARLIAALLVGAWRVAFREALHQHPLRRAAANRELFLSLLDKGFDGATAAARGTPYA